jgi:hypothetical protein
MKVKDILVRAFYFDAFILGFGLGTITWMMINLVFMRYEFALIDGILGTFCFIIVSIRLLRNSTWK